MGQMQRGEIDMLMTYFTITTTRMKYFEFPGPIVIDRINILLRRQLPAQIRVDSLSANIQLYVYLVFIIMVLMLTGIYAFHTRLNLNQNTDYVWQMLKLCLPGSPSVPLPRDKFMTTNIISLTINIATFMFIIYYQCQQLSALLVPLKRPVLKDIQHLQRELLDGRIRTSFIMLSSNMETELKSGTFKLAKQLQKVWEKYPSLHESKVLKNADAVANKSTMIIGLRSNLYAILSHIEPDTCNEYELITLEEMAPQMIGLAFRPRYPYIKNMSEIIVARRNWIEQLINENQLNSVCREQMFPTEDQETTFLPLSIYMINGVFVAYLCCGLVSFLIILVEVLIHRHFGSKLISDKTHFYLDVYIDYNDERLLEQYKLVQQIVNNEQLLFQQTAVTIF